MRKTLATTILLALCGTCSASAASDNVDVSHVSVERQGNYLAVDMTFGLSGLKVKGNRAVLLTPRISNGRDSVTLPAVGIYGRKRYYHYRRKNGEAMISGNGEMTYRASQVPSTIKYHEMVAYKDWMDGSYLNLLGEDYGCCGNVLAENDRQIGDYAKYVPQLLFVKPHADKNKTRAAEGSAFIDFAVNKTAIVPDYRRNASELAKIQETIDSVKSDEDYTITSVQLKGYASPEGSYAHNSELARGRTESLRGYVSQLYNFENGVITTDYEAEDWAGLRQYVEESSLEHRSEILAIIDDRGMDPDVKEGKIKTEYPLEYGILLNTCYPKLRHTDYKVVYNVKVYSSADEIRKVIRRRPQNLSLDEFYIVAQECEPGSEEFMYIFETAVKMYPDDEIANLNAGNAAISHGDLYIASKYLEKAGDSGEADYARAVCAYMQDDKAAATHFLIEAQNKGIKEATDMM
ncbi:MAG: DUF3868 domain-containing protein, partial [Prevotella sp.]|nr:DUF3868 domain-containing protein [Prevotella sp.]